MAEIEVLLDFGRPYVRLDDYNEMKDRYWKQVALTQDADDEAAKWKEHARALLARAEAAEARVAGLEAQLAAQQWIRVDDDPDMYNWYLTYNAEDEDLDNIGMNVSFYDGTWEHECTHYRPLPPAPQEPTQ